MDKRTTKTTKKTPKAKAAQKPGTRAAGKPETQIRRTYKGRELVVDVVEGKYKFEGETYASLSALAKHIVGYGISGPNFFRTADKPSEAE